MRVRTSDVKRILNWPPWKKPRSVFALQRLEETHEALDLYRWLRLVYLYLSSGEILLRRFKKMFFFFVFFGFF